MGLSRSNTGLRAGRDSERGEAGELVLALAGCPNVGKSSVFNRLTGGRQHTGNWAGKTVSCARGSFRGAEHRYTLVDLPGTCSLLARSSEEALARDYICFGGAEGVILVCDACNIARSMALLLQLREVGGRVLLCVNLMDEAERKGIRLDLKLLPERLGVPVVAISARRKQSRAILIRAIDAWMAAPPGEPLTLCCSEAIETAVQRLLPLAEPLCRGRLNARWLCLRLLEGDGTLLDRADEYLGGALSRAEALRKELSRLRSMPGFDPERLGDHISAALIRQGEALCRDAVSAADGAYGRRDRQIDRVVTGRVLAWPLMLILLSGLLYLTIAGANGLSALLSTLFSRAERVWEAVLHAAQAPPWLQGLLLDGAWRVLSWVVAVMLPPMAIFFPLFALLEDLGYLPRVAYNLDRPFQRCGACGKMGLTMCMGLGCNAAGVVGCRIIDSERERLLAVLTNSLVPCNGRFPMLIAVLGMFFTGTTDGTAGTLRSALLLTALIVLSVALTLVSSRFLSATLLKGTPSSFVLELPPYRMPQVGSVLLRSTLDQSLFVLGRAAAVAIPAGLLLWVMANVQMDGVSLLAHSAAFLEPLGRFFGLDGVILLAFLLGLPANETVLPIIHMAYSAQGIIQTVGSLAEVRALLVQNGWTEVTALCVLLFSLLHWPCSTTLLTIKRETGRWSWTALAAALPTSLGLLLCALTVNLLRLFGFS